METQGFNFGFELRPYQRQAIKAVEKGLAENRPHMLVAMATGTGKTKLAIAMLYRLIAAKRFRSVCFVVDRSALGEQTEREFTTTKVVGGKAFAEIFGLKGLSDVTPDPRPASTSAPSRASCGAPCSPMIPPMRRRSINTT